MSTVPRNQIDRSYSLSRQISGQALPTLSNVGDMTSGDQAGAGAQRTEEPKSFSPKKPVKLNTPKEDPITVSELKKCDGSDPEKPTWVAIKGTVFDVSGNKAYQPGGQYHGTCIFPSIDGLSGSVSRGSRIQNGGSIEDPFAASCNSTSPVFLRETQVLSQPKKHIPS